MAEFPVSPFSFSSKQPQKEVAVSIEDLGIENNLYIYVDGREYGSLFFQFDKNGKITITLGQYDETEQQWTDRNPIRVTPDSAQIPL